MGFCVSVRWLVGAVASRRIRDAGSWGGADRALAFRGPGGFVSGSGSE